MSRPWTDEDRLRELYVEKDLTYDEVADRLGCSVSTIKKWAGKFNLGDEKKPWKDRDRMYRLYIEQDLSQQEVADELGCSYQTVNRWIKKHDIPVKSHGGKTEKPWHDEKKVREIFIEKDLTLEEAANRLGCDDATLSYWIDKFGLRESIDPEKYWQEEEFLRWRYFDKGQTIAGIAEEVGVDDGTVHKWMQKHGIDTSRTGHTETCVRCGEEFRIPPNKSDLVHQCSDCFSEYGVLEEKKERLSGLRTGWEWDEEARERMSESHSGKKLTDKHKNNIGKAFEGEGNPHYGKFGENHPAYGHDGFLDTEWKTVEATGHSVKSSWEEEIDLLLHEAGIEYGYETERFEFTELTYTPDFILGDTVVEVKGLVTPESQRRAEILMNKRPDLTYIVVGNREYGDLEIPCDIHISWDDRESLMDYL